MPWVRCTQFPALLGPDQQLSVLRAVPERSAGVISTHGRASAGGVSAVPGVIRIASTVPSTNEEERMATNADYTADEWQILQWAVSDTMAYLSMADPGLWDSFKEAAGAARYIAEQKTESENFLVRELATDLRTKRDRDVTSNPSDVSGEVVARIGEAVALVAEKDESDLPAFRAFILGLAEATAQAADGIGRNEADAIEKLTVALG